MSFFKYKGDRLYCESVSLARLANEVGTPFYAYSYSALTNQFDLYDQAFQDIPHLLCFAVKANSNVAILRAVAQKGGGADIVTGGELFRCVRARVPPRKIVFSGVGKSEEEITYALKQGILLFNVESAEELKAIERVAKRMKKKAAVSLRVNPNIDPKTHPYISTGLKKSKFGIPVKDALELYEQRRRYPHLNFIGVSCHIGSQITELGPFQQATARLQVIVKKLRRMGVAVSYVDIGGGLGISYHKEKPPSPAVYVKALRNDLASLKATIIFEPGRSLMGNAGVFVTKVLYNKAQGGKKFVVVDGAMNDLLRPALYESYHDIKPVCRRRGTRRRVDVVGPICESGDFLAQERSLPLLKSGALLAVLGTGAYGFTMSSNYNSRPRVPEVLIRDGASFVIRERESYKDLPRGEHVPRFLG